MIMGCLYVHACRGPLGMARSTQLAPLHVIAFGGMLDGVGGPCEHSFMVFIIGTATALSSSTIVVAPSGTTAPTTTTTPAATTTRQLHLMELDVGLG